MTEVSRTAATEPPHRVWLPAAVRIFLNFLGSLFLVSLLIYTIVSFTPGSMAEIHNLSQATASQLHLDRPLWLRFLFWIRDCLTLDFGVSLVNGSRVSDLVRQFAPPTLVLAFGSILVSLVVSLPLGIYLGLNPDSRIGKILSLAVYSVSSVPVFVLGYLVLAVIFGFFEFYSTTMPEPPFRFWPWFSYYIVPILVLAVGNGTMGEFVRFISLEARSVNSAMYIKSVRARGCSLRGHFFRSMVLPVFNIVATQIAVLLGGLVVVERIFNLHGLGWLSWESTLKRDFFVIMGITLLMAFIVRAFMLANEFLAYWLDPRLRG